MDLIPAIDLLDGGCVRLLRGDFQQCTFYEGTPADIAAAYAGAGARWLHVVDLAASRDGASADTAPLFGLLSASVQHIQTGGGIRCEADVEARLEAGATRVVIGSLAATEPQRVATWLNEFGPEAIVAALDINHDEDGVPRVRSHGWTRESGQALWHLLGFFADRGLQHVLITDIQRDGAMSGPNLSLYEAVRHRFPAIELQASGGIRDVADLAALSRVGASAAISGKALLEGCYTIEAALDALATV